MKKAFITGITGQDGSYLAEYLLNKGYMVHGLIRRSSNFNTQRIENIFNHTRLKLHYGDLTDSSVLSKLINNIRPHEVYNLGAQSHVAVSFEVPEYTVNSIAMGTINLLEAIRACVFSIGRPMKYYQASSSEMFGNPEIMPITEKTPFDPKSPYGCAKLYAFHQTKNYRESYGMFACNGILFNHESPRRGETFVTRKITRAVTRIKLGLQNELVLGNLDAKRDWGYAGDYVRAMHRMLQVDRPDDYIISTGESYSVRDFLTIAFGHYDLYYEQYVKSDPKYIRPSEIKELRGDYSKAKSLLNWNNEVSFEELVKMMCDSDMDIAEQEYINVES